MEKYELTLIFKSDLTEEKIDAILAKLKIKEEAKKVWGKRFLAYPIKEQKEGIYVHLDLKIKPEQTKELERQISLENKILRYLIIKVEK